MGCIEEECMKKMIILGLFCAFALLLFGCIAVDGEHEPPGETSEMWVEPIPGENEGGLDEAIIKPEVEEGEHPALEEQEVGPGEKAVQEPEAEREEEAEGIPEELVQEGLEEPGVWHVGDRILMFHNGKGPMCVEALEFFETVDYPLDQRLNTEEEFWEELNGLIGVYGKSGGVSNSFRYYPIIFVKDRAYSGFNREMGEEILEFISE